MPVPLFQVSSRLIESVPNLTPHLESPHNLERSATVATGIRPSTSNGISGSSFIFSQRQNFARLRQRLQSAAQKALGSSGRLPHASTVSNVAAVSGDQLLKKTDTQGSLLLCPDAWGPQLSLKTRSFDENCALPAESEPEIARRRKGASLEDVNESKSTFSSETRLSKPILVLDLDETLIHSSLMPRRASDFWIEVVQNNDVRTREVFWVYKRPGVDEFLAQVSEYFTVHVFTAGIREYASQILDRLDPTGTLISRRLYRDECTEIRGQGTYAKDLSKIEGDLSRVILVDNTPACFTMQPANGLPIKSWYSDVSDRQLHRLRDFLIDASSARDLRVALTEWSMH